MYPRVEAMLFWDVAQAVLISVLETWVLLEVMEKKVKGTNTSFMRQITENRAQRKADGRFVTPRA